MPAPKSSFKLGKRTLFKCISKCNDHDDDMNAAEFVYGFLFISFNLFSSLFLEPVSVVVVSSDSSKEYSSISPAGGFHVEVVFTL